MRATRAVTSVEGTVVVDDGSAHALPFTAWDAFVFRHSSRLNMQIHVVSFLMFWLGIPLAVLLWSPYPLAMFFGSGLIGALGHKITGDSAVSAREATSDPLVVLFASKAALLFVVGKYDAHIERARARAAVVDSRFDNTRIDDTHDANTALKREDAEHDSDAHRSSSTRNL